MFFVKLFLMCSLVFSLNFVESFKSICEFQEMFPEEHQRLREIYDRKQGISTISGAPSSTSNPTTSGTHDSTSKTTTSGAHASTSKTATSGAHVSTSNTTTSGTNASTSNTTTSGAHVSTSNTTFSGASASTSVESTTAITTDLVPVADPCLPNPGICGCVDPENNGNIVPNGTYFVNYKCTMLGYCNNGTMEWDIAYNCSEAAVCETRNETRKCYCRIGYQGDGQTCDITDCQDVMDGGNSTSGIYTIKPLNWSGSPFNVYCYMSGELGWLVFQRRVNGSVDFYRNWINYKEGFGELDHEFWLGNEKLFYLTNQEIYQLKISMVDRTGEPFSALFDHFRINDESDNYRLSELGNYSGTADTMNGYSLLLHEGLPFSTFDQDHDNENGNCAIGYHGAWWYKQCGASNLNGDYHATIKNTSIFWEYLAGYPWFIEHVVMQIGRVST
ncbi:uncharacterized protein [Apostichopus japonicus]|uniref:uncharacterized protein n=1 Tax=Stichopus japonicus TaxID=307972 RepID=UPI003AB32B3E